MDRLLIPRHDSDLSIRCVLEEPISVPFNHGMHRVQRILIPLNQKCAQPTSQDAVASACDPPTTPPARYLFPCSTDGYSFVGVRRSWERADTYWHEMTVTHSPIKAEEPKDMTIHVQVGQTDARLQACCDDLIARYCGG